jgi:hypothetical protein
MAVTRYWVGKGINNNWNNTANWSASSGGAGGATLPVAGDNAIFDGAGTGTYRLSCTINANITVSRLRSLAGFIGGIINQGPFTVTVNGTDLSWNEGTFNGGSGLFTVGTTSTAIDIAGGTFNIGTGGFKATGGGAFDISGGTMTIATGAFYSDKTFTITAGSFNGGSAQLKFRNNNFNLNGGTFNSTTTDIHFSSASVFIRSVPGWVHNNCTVYFDSTNSTDINFGAGPNTTCDFYKVIVNKTSATNDNLRFTDSDTMNVLADMDITDGQLIYSSALIKLFGNLTAETDFSNSNVDIMFSGSSNQTINLKGASYDKMDGRFFVRKPNTSLLTLLSPLKLDAGITNTFVIEKGIVITSTANLLTIDDGTLCKNSIASTIDYYIEDDNAFVEGPVQKNGNDYFVFPLGNRATVNGQKAAPIGISGSTNPLIGLGATASFQANYYPVDPSGAGYNRSSKDAILNNIQACEYWTLNRVSGSASAFVWTSYRDGGHSCGGSISAVPSVLHVTRWDGTKWTDHGYGTFRQPYNYHICSFSSVSSFSPFTTASIDPLLILPVALTSFSVSASECSAILNWKTSFEQDLKIFEVQQSDDGINFTPVASVNARGTASVYSFHPSQYVSNAYYRLKMIDRDGNHQYSNVVVVKLNCNKNIVSLDIYPTILNAGTEIKLNYTVADPKGAAWIIISDANGREISKTPLTLNRGTTSATIQSTGLRKGIYYVLVKRKDWKTETKKFVIY